MQGGFSFFFRRLLRALITMWVAVSAIFFALRTIPGDAADAMMGQQMSAEGAELIRRQLGLDQPVISQYLSFMGDLLRGDLGLSMAIGKPVSELLWQVAPFTAVVVIGALVIGSGIGIPLGISAAKRRNSMIDMIARTLSLTGLVIPGFIVGILLMIPFAVWLGWFPLVGGGDAHDFWSLLYYGTLPALAGGLGMAAYMTRLTRASVLDLMSEDFVRTARAKGLSENTVFYRHVLRNALVPIVTFLGLYTVIMIGDSIAIEIVFSRPGFGRLILGGITQRDYTLLQSVLLVYVIVALIVNFVVDLLYVWIDPRIKLSM
ncbi:ABC transporter permease [Aureimonas fodinaquatilis]|uniref:ABC transporter permease n=1 Tax=Aureimonas fodinaquatilis TaxID=2565783 RepID=A0A5B0DT89_9HYPH|nr:ABC transporter permease [Aureimonas fodinaquatilis]KAA0969623.1 ABC transporter permease [Aureimonas fodinaquatilis]